MLLSERKRGLLSLPFSDSSISLFLGFFRINHKEREILESDWPRDLIFLKSENTGDPEGIRPDSHERRRQRERDKGRQSCSIFIFIV